MSAGRRDSGDPPAMRGVYPLRVMIRFGWLLVAALLAESGLLQAGSFVGKGAESKDKIIYVDAKNAFVAIDKGPRDGIRAGTEFTIVRESQGVSRILGKGVCEKFLGQNTLSKIAVTSGEAREMTVGDVALYEGGN